MDYWDKLISSNPKLADSDKITLSVEEFRRQIEKAWQAGHNKAKADDPVDRFMDRLNKIRR